MSRNQDGDGQRPLMLWPVGMFTGACIAAFCLITANEVLLGGNPYYNTLFVFWAVMMGVYFMVDLMFRTLPKPQMPDIDGIVRQRLELAISNLAAKKRPPAPRPQMPAQSQTVSEAVYRELQRSDTGRPSYDARGGIAGAVADPLWSGAPPAPQPQPDAAYDLPDAWRQR